jgi:hypothetical protein
MELLSVAGLTVGGYIVYKVFTMKFGGPTANLEASTPGPQGYYSDDKLSQSEQHLLDMFAHKSVPPKVVVAKKINEYLYHVNVDGSMIELNTQGFDKLMTLRDNFKLIWE